MNVKVIKSTSYGRIRYYPNCDNSNLVCKLIKKTTMDDIDLGLLRESGHEIEITQKETK